MNAPSDYISPLSTDTTYQIAEHYFTQTGYENLSVLRRDTLKNPWLPGVCILHREKVFENFAYLWQVAKRSNCSLSSLRVLGTDDDKAIYDAIPYEYDGCTQHSLGLEHFKKNIKDKLQKLNFPKRQAKIISEDIFETLYNCKDEQEFDSELEKLRDKWMEIEVRYTRNEPPGQFLQYFEQFKANAMKFKTTRYAQNKAGLTYDYWQNPIEWSNHITKSEINENSESSSKNAYKTESLTNVIKALKKLHLRYYENVVKALTDRGPYILAPPFKSFLVAYDEWNDMTIEAKQQHIKSFLSCIPSANDLLEVLPARQVPASTKTQSTTARQNEDETMSLVEKKGSLPSPLLLKNFQYQRKTYGEQTLLMVVF